MPSTAVGEYVGLGEQEDVTSAIWQLQQMPREQLLEEMERHKPEHDCRPDEMRDMQEFLFICYDWTQQPYGSAKDVASGKVVERPPTPGREPLDIDEENDCLIIGLATQTPEPKIEQRRLRDFRDEFIGRPNSRDHVERLRTVGLCLQNANARKMAGSEPEVFWPLGGGNSFPLGDGDRLWARSSGHWHCVVDAYMNAIHALGGLPKSRFRNDLRNKFGGNCPLNALLGIKPFSRDGVVYALRPLKHVS
eukprot:g80178.t1